MRRRTKSSVPWQHLACAIQASVRDLAFVEKHRRQHKLFGIIRRKLASLACLYEVAFAVFSKFAVVTFIVVKSYATPREVLERRHLERVVVGEI